MYKVVSGVSPYIDDVYIWQLCTMYVDVCMYMYEHVLPNYHNIMCSGAYSYP